MSERSFDINEFIEKPAEPKEEANLEEAKVEASEPSEVDVQKAVVESLAEDKAKLVEEIEDLKKQISARDAEIEGHVLKAKELETSLESARSRSLELEESSKRLEAEKLRLDAKIAELENREYDMQERNPNALALLDRDVEVADRFPGETRDHVIEAISKFRDQAEAEGRLRRAQVLESVLVANEPNGTLAKRRAELEKIFRDNNNILSGTVIAELDRLGIAYRDGESYLLASEILKRTF